MTNLINIIEIGTCPADLRPLMNIIKNGVVPLLQIGIPLMLVIWGMLDLGKAVVAGKEDEIKKNQQILIKRAISAVMVFFVVTLVSVIFGWLIGKSDSTDITNNTTNWKDCWDLKFTDDVPVSNPPPRMITQ